MSNKPYSFDPKYAVLTAKEMIAAEVATFNTGIAAFTLMLSAGRGLASAILAKKKNGKILFLNGPGNNGGDGWIAAELLRRKGWEVTCVALGLPQGETLCAASEAYGKYQGKTGDFPDHIDDFDVIVDALFGTGLVRPVEGKPSDWIKAANEADALRVACDIPSGISSDTGQILGTAFDADLTVTFSHKKRGHVLMPGLEFAGEVVVNDIGISEDAIMKLKPTIFDNAPALWKEALPKPGKGDYKHQRGHLLVIGGPAEMSGAARMAARSALRSGAGLVTTLAPRDAVPVYAEKQLAVMSAGYDGDKEFEAAVTPRKYDAFVIGPGNGVGPDTCARVEAILKTGHPAVLDADALTSFETDSRALFKMLHERCVLTPHIGEFKRLWPSLDPEADKIGATKTAAKKAGCIILLKGPDTLIATPDGQVIVNTHAAPQLATAGSGDVLAGIIGGMLAQGMAPFLAAAAGAWIHGDTSLRLGAGLIAEDLIEKVPEVLAEFFK